MADSDDEYDRRRGRDKFRRERNDYNDRPTNNRREDWQEGGGWSTSQRDRNQAGRRDYRDNYNSGGRINYGRNDRFSPADRSGDMSPPSKRIRGGRDWDDRYPNYELGGGYYTSHHSGNFRENWSHDRDRDDDLYQPQMQTLKQFVNNHEDLDGEVLITKYNEYKNNFKRTQIQEFFNRHKDEEWFRCKYFPDEIEKRKAKIQQSYQHRLEVFMELYDSKYMDNVSMDVDKGEQIIKVLDATVIKLEGGTDFDLLALNTETEEQKNKDSIFAVVSSTTTKATPTTTNEATKTETTTNETEVTQSNEEENSNLDEIKESKPEEKPELVPELNKTKDETNDDSGDGELIEEGEDANKDKSEQFSTEKNELDENEKKPRALHKTCSIFFRNLAPSITRQEIEDECRKFEGFLRLAISEPQMDRRFNRRGWATYERTVNIREICWKLNSVKIRGTDLSPIVNRDLTRRIRSVNGISSHKTVVRADIRHAAKLIMKLDFQKKLWEDDEENKNEEFESKNNALNPSRNPLLKNITDYLIEEAPAEEAELLGTSVEDPLVSPELESSEANGNATASGTEGTQLERDEDLIKVLDRLLLYLRIVHSIDYYNHCEYPNEDEMPNRIGLVHARGLISSARVTPVEITDYLKEQETKIQPFLQATPEVTEEEAKNLGLKDIDEAVEAFIKENTKELCEGKWLCPLSNKKFMAPEFVRKHILNKHMERVEQVKAETHYFNNYILDPKRPQLPEHPLNRPPGQNQNRQHESSGGGYGGMYNQRGGPVHMPSMMSGYGNRYGPGGYMSPMVHMDQYARKRREQPSSRDAVDYDDVAFEELI